MMVPVFVFNVRFTKEGLHLVQNEFGLNVGSMIRGSP